jgi:hypothetical protein
LQANAQLDTTLELLVGSSYAGAHAPGASASANATSPANADTTGGTTAANASCTA